MLPVSVLTTRNVSPPLFCSGSAQRAGKLYRVYTTVLPWSYIFCLTTPLPAVPSPMLFCLVLSSPLVRFHFYPVLSCPIAHPNARRTASYPIPCLTLSSCPVSMLSCPVWFYPPPCLAVPSPTLPSLVISSLIWSRSFLLSCRVPFLSHSFLLFRVLKFVPTYYFHV